jgi:hypothetical protein
MFPGAGPGLTGGLLFENTIYLTKRLYSIIIEGTILLSFNNIGLLVWEELF